MIESTSTRETIEVMRSLIINKELERLRLMKYKPSDKRENKLNAIDSKINYLKSFVLAVS